MSEKNLNYTETLGILKRELEILGIAFLWVYAHYALKRAFFFSLLRCQSYLNVPFKRKDVRNPLYWVRWGSGIEVVYPIVKLLIRSYHKELLRHPFFRTLTTRKPVLQFNYEKVFPDLNKLLTESVSNGGKYYASITKRPIRRNNIWSKMTGAGYIAHRPHLVLGSSASTNFNGLVRIRKHYNSLSFRSKKLRNRN